MNEKKGIIDEFFPLFCYNSFMKLRPRKARTIIPYVIIYLLIVIVTYFPIGFVWPPTLYHYLSLGAWTIGFTLFIYVGVRYNSYEIHKSHIVHLKGQARLTYNFSSILYIDIPYTNKHKTLLFYTDQGDARYLVLDPKNILLTKTLERAKNVISKEEFQAKFPRVKL